MSEVTICSDFGTPPKKICHCFHCFPIYLPWSDGTGCHDLSLWMLKFKPTFLLSSFIFIKRLFSSSSLSAIRVVSSAYLGLLIFLPALLIPAVLHPAQHFLWCILHISLISRVAIYSLDILLFLFGTGLLFHVQFRPLVTVCVLIKLMGSLTFFTFLWINLKGWPDNHFV